MSVSVETLRAELTGMELRLVDRINDALRGKAEQAVVDQIELRVGALEISRAERSHLPAQMNEVSNRVTKLERFRYSVPSAAMLAVLVSLAGLLLAFFR